MRLKLKDVLGLFTNKFKKQILIQSCFICGCPSDFIEIEYYVDNNQVIVINTKFLCFECDKKINDI